VRITEELSKPARRKVGVIFIKRTERTGVCEWSRNWIEVASNVSASIIIVDRYSAFLPHHIVISKLNLRFFVEFPFEWGFPQIERNDEEIWAGYFNSALFIRDRELIAFWTNSFYIIFIVMRRMMPDFAVFSFLQTYFVFTLWCHDCSRTWTAALR